MANNFMYITGAGTGKTTFILNDIFSKKTDSVSIKILIITYTTKNQVNIKNRIIDKYGYIPSDIIVIGWYSFLLDYWIKPFKGSIIEELFNHHISLSFVEGVSGLKKANGHYYHNYKRTDLKKKFLSNDYGIYSDKISEFACQCYNKNKELLLNRLENIFNYIYIDEAQDLSAWDYEIMKILLLNSNYISFTLCGDPRQSTYTTSKSDKWEKYRGRIDLFFKQEVNTSKNTYITIDENTLNKNHRSSALICQFASNIMPEFPIIKPCSCDKCMTRRAEYSKISGVFFIKQQDVERYIEEYSPMILRWDSKTNVKENRFCHVYTYGESKGLESNASLIYPTKTILKDYLLDNTNKLSVLSKCKLYVAITRARYITAIVIDDDQIIKNTHLPILYELN